MSDGEPPNDLSARIAAVSPAWKAALATRPPAARRAQVLADTLGLGVDLIYEGYALHRGTSGMLVDGASADLRLLVGDFCYAAGLCEVAAAGDLAAVRSLADLIADTAVLALEQPRPADAPDPRELRWDGVLADLALH
jgi:hypothetical protein